MKGRCIKGVSPAEALLPDEVTGRYDTVFIAVKTHHTRAAVQQILPHLEAGGVIVSAQNSLNELTIAEMAGIRRTVGCLVNFGAD